MFLMLAWALLAPPARHPLPPLAPGTGHICHPASGTVDFGVWQPQLSHADLCHHQGAALALHISHQHVLLFGFSHICSGWHCHPLPMGTGHPAQPPALRDARGRMVLGRDTALPAHTVGAGAEPPPMVPTVPPWRPNPMGAGTLSTPYGPRVHRGNDVSFPVLSSRTKVALSVPKLRHIAPPACGKGDSQGSAPTCHGSASPAVTVCQ